MKSLLALIFITTLICSCSSDIQDNSPALQGVVDSILFRSADSRAIFTDDGGLLVQGNSDAQTLNLLINSLNQTQVQLGGDNPNTNIASYTDAFGNVFSTASTKTPLSFIPEITPSKVLFIFLDMNLTCINLIEDLSALTATSSLEEQCKHNLSKF